MSQVNTEQAIMLIRFFNMQAGASFKHSNEANINAVSECIDKVVDIVSIKNFIREWVKTNTANVINCFNDCADTLGKKDVAVEEVVDIEQPVRVTEQSVKYSMGVLEKAVIGIIAQTQADKIKSEIMDGVKSTIADYIKSEYGSIERKVTTVVDGKKVELEGVQHEVFDTVLKFVANNEPVFLTGAAGSGKNVICQQVATALGLKFYFSNAVTQEYKITGFTDAMGVYQETQFYKAFKDGGLFMLDEMDASIPEVLIILNAAIANRYFDFPAPIGYVEAHKDFRIISAGNTYGLGADYEYCGRNQLDMASLDRFALVRINYSPFIELNVAQGNSELVTFCQEFRKSAVNSGVKALVSYRAIGRIAKLETLLGLEECLKTCLCKSLEKDDLNLVANGISTNSKYKNAITKIVKEMESK